MSFPTPVPGLVIRYSFLWSHEAEAGAIEASKDRPCAIVVAVRKTEEDDLRVIVAPITHAPPEQLEVSLEISAGAAKALGLDGERHWLRADELNSFAWPGFDLRPIPQSEGAYSYGMLSEALYEDLRQMILKIRKKGKGKTILNRD